MAAPRSRRSQLLAHAVSRTALYATLLFFSFLFLFPFVWMLSTSVKELPQAMKIPPEWIPAPWR